jgi:RNA polymerase sigma-70 factor (ECF subfamily)
MAIFRSFFEGTRSMPAFIPRMRALAKAAVMRAEPRWDTVSLHRAHADFVWRTLQRLAVPEADLEDAFQEVFIVVHRRLHTFDDSSKITTWLFGVCRRVAAGSLRRAHRRREQLSDAPPSSATDADPEQSAAEAQGRTRLYVLLDRLTPEQRAVLIMFEIEGLGCGEIAATLGVPVGTVHSRLHAARDAFEAAVRRERLRELKGGST